MIAGLPAEAIQRVGMKYEPTDLSQDYKRYYGVSGFQSSPTGYGPALSNTDIDGVIEILDHLIDNHYHESL